MLCHSCSHFTKIAFYKENVANAWYSKCFPLKWQSFRDTGIYSFFLLRENLLLKFLVISMDHGMKQ